MKEEEKDGIQLLIMQIVVMQMVVLVEVMELTTKTKQVLVLQDKAMMVEKVDLVLVLVEVEAGIVTQQPITALLVPDISLGMAAVLLVTKVDEVEKVAQEA